MFCSCCDLISAVSSQSRSFACFKNIPLHFPLRNILFTLAGLLKVALAAGFYKSTKLPIVPCVSGGFVSVCQPHGIWVLWNGKHRAMVLVGTLVVFLKKSCSSQREWRMSQSDAWGNCGLRANIQERWTFFLCPKVCWARGILGLGESLKRWRVYWLRIASSLAVHFPSLDGHM